MTGVRFSYPAPIKEINKSMSDPTSIFDQNQNPATQPSNQGANPNAQNSNDLANQLLLIKNERGEPKYKSLEDAIVALKHSQEYIPQLSAQLAQREQELKEAREAAARVAELERTLEALTSQQSNANNQQAPAFDENKIVEVVTQTLTRRQQEELAKVNLTTVVSTLTNTFGAEAEKTYNAKADEIGMTVAELNALAAKNPKAVFKLLGISQEAPKSQSSSSSATTYNTAGFQPTQDSFIGRNKTPTLIGATTTDLNEETLRSKKMVEELHRQGMTISDLTNPKTYFKTFK